MIQFKQGDKVALDGKGGDRFVVLDVSWYRESASATPVRMVKVNDSFDCWRPVSLNRAEYSRNLDARRLSARERSRERRAYIASLKNHPCMDCGGVFPSEAMDFDHRPGEVKLFSIAQRAAIAQELLDAEIAKCDLVCANCHRARTRKRGRWSDDV